MEQSNHTRRLTPACDVAVIGGGCAGVLTSAQLLRQAKSPLTVTLIERNADLGRGVAYSAASDLHVLNVPARSMSAWPDDTDHFMRWLKTRPDTGWDGTEGAFIKRRHYGEYLASVLKEAQSLASPDVRLNRIQDEAVALDAEESPLEVHLASGAILRARKVVLAVGNFPPANPRVADDGFFRSHRYVPYAWTPGALDRIGVDDTVVLIGSGLTMVDMVAALHERKQYGLIYAIARHGLMPQPHRPSIPRKPFMETHPGQRVVEMLRRVRHEISEAAGNWRAVIDALRPQTQALWRSLEVKARRQFLRHVRPWWEVHRHRVSPKISDLFTEKLNSGAVKMVTGRLAGFREERDAVEVMVKLRKQTGRVGLRAQYVVNCTGPEADYRKLGHPLIDHMLEHGHVRPDRLALGLDTALNGALLNAWGEVSGHLFTLGSPRKGGLWETTAVPEIRVQALELARTILADC